MKKKRLQQTATTTRSGHDSRIRVDIVGLRCKNILGKNSGLAVVIDSEVSEIMKRRSNSVRDAYSMDDASR
jgi:hypothetical protein